jgi:hypothetical protein
MRKNISIKTAAIAVILACIISASVVASVLYQRTVTNTMRVVGGNFKLILGTDLATEVTAISWGDFLPLEAKNSSSIIGNTINIYNMANLNLVFCWNYTGLDEAKWTLICKRDIGTTLWDINDWDEFSVAPNGQNGYLVFYLTNKAGGMGDYQGFTINVYSMKNPTT